MEEAIQFETQGDVSNAEKAWKRAVAIKPFHVKRFIEVSPGRCDQSQGDVIKAKKVRKRAAAIKPLHF